MINIARNLVSVLALGLLALVFSVRESHAAACTKINSLTPVGLEYGISTGTINGTATVDSNCFDLAKSGAAFSVSGSCTGTTINVSLHWAACTTSTNPCDTANFVNVPIDGGTDEEIATRTSTATLSKTTFFPQASRYAVLRTTGVSGNGTDTACTWSVFIQGFSPQ